MKKYIFIFFSAFISFSTLYSQPFYSKDNTTGAYNEEDSWIPRGQWDNPRTPHNTSSPNAKIYIVATSHITKTGDFNPVELEVLGTFILNGDFINNGWAGLTVKSGGSVVIYGNIAGGAGIKVENGGKLTIYGNLTSTSSGINVARNMVVKGNFSTSSNTILNTTGKLVVGGDFAHAGGTLSGTSNENLYIINPDANITGPGWSSPIYDGEYGVLEDFIENESDNPGLWDLVEDVMPEFVGSPFYEWIGGDGNDWFNPNNWNKNKVPDKDSKVVITSESEVEVFPKEDNLPIEIYSIDVKGNATISMMPGSKMTVRDDINIDASGHFILNNRFGGNGLVSLITEGNVNGDFDIKVTLPTNSWYYLSSPAKEPDKNYLGSALGGAYVYGYNNNQWVKDADFNVADGGLVYFETFDSSVTEIEIEYSGKINNGNPKIEYKSKGYYLFGNPYPSSIDWRDISKERIYSSIWYRTRINQELVFVTYNPEAPEGANVAVLPDDMDNMSDLALIPPYQSVWVYTRTASAQAPASIDLDKSNRAHSADKSILKSSSREKADIIRVTSNNGLSRDGAVIYFDKNSTESGDDAGDSYKYFNGSENIPEIYTRAGKTALSINGMPTFDGTNEVPLSVRNRVDGEVELKFDFSYYRSDDLIVLHDRILDQKVNLRKVNRYKYEPLVLGDDHERFVMLFNPEYYNDDDLSTPLDANEANNIEVFYDGDYLNIYLDEYLIDVSSVEIFNLSGISLGEYKISEFHTTIKLPAINEFVIIKLNSAKGFISYKLLI